MGVGDRKRGLRVFVRFVSIKVPIRFRLHTHLQSQRLHQIEPVENDD